MRGLCLRRCNSSGVSGFVGCHVKRLRVVQLSREEVEYGSRLGPQGIPAYLLRTLALIAHEQPMLQTELKFKLGDKVYEHVGELLELGMIQREHKGRTFELSVTAAFKEYFGIDAESQAEMKAYLEQALTS